MRQRGAGPRNVTAAFEFALSFPTPPPTSSDSITAEPHAKRQKTEIPLEVDVAELGVNTVKSEASEVDCARSLGPFVFGRIDTSLENGSTRTASTAINNVSDVPKAANRPTRGKRKLPISVETQNVAKDIGDDSFIAHVKPKRTRAVKKQVEALPLQEAMHTMEPVAEVELPPVKAAKARPRKKAAAPRTARVKKAQAKKATDVEPPSIQDENVTVNAVQPDLNEAPVAATNTSLATGTQAGVEMPGEAMPPASKARSRKKAVPKASVNSSTTALVKPRKTAARAVARFGEKEELEAAPLVIDGLASARPETRAEVVQRDGVQGLSRKKPTFSYAEDLDDTELDSLPKPKSKKRAPARKSAKSAPKADAGKKRKRAVSSDELSEEMFAETPADSVEQSAAFEKSAKSAPPKAVSKERKRVATSDEPSSATLERDVVVTVSQDSPAVDDSFQYARKPSGRTAKRRPLEETHANIVRPPSASPNKLLSVSATQNTEKPKRLSKPVTKANRENEENDMDWLVAPPANHRLPIQRTTSTATTVPRKRRKLADVVDLDLDDLVANVDSFEAKTTVRAGSRKKR
ncbi:hypothetical protein LTR56_017062 [Elasticomyces elasticus]|nr:hypothetical protein LTR56_017062 [Elasticomyces elasticus]KAK3643808.1 hypothetical protein LTR22_015545 [Elasticomyces elasticus]KAK4912672.1 hypothetical protein LTR49_018941 [Elasticomyces elasticus]KAK5752106.1 hypothetical protein LTS12_017785 [Elasticomyces elasticus]